MNRVDVAVLVIFFSRDEQLKQVFESVRCARPTKLYLYQDGPRKGNISDIEGIRKCQEIVSDSNIDWDCEVHRYYQKNNLGCDPSEYVAQKWFFENEEKGIILEDDDVPSISFFRYCKELLDYYQDDERIQMICGMNNYDVNESVEDSYFYSTRGSIWGWATWKRIVDSWDPNYSFLENPESLRLLRHNFTGDFEQFIRTCKRHKASGREHYESINGASQFLNNRVNIVPKYNMITNIGIASTSTHSVDNIKKIPLKIQKLFYKKAYDIEFPLKHPRYVMIDKDFDNKFNESKMEKICNRVERKIRKIVYK